MKQTFYAPADKTVEVKALVRSFSSFRFLSNPMTTGNSTEFRLEGKVEEFNQFDLELDKLLKPKETSDKPKSLLSRLSNLFFSESNSEGCFCPKPSSKAQKPLTKP
jgi:hypothetical protein